MTEGSVGEVVNRVVGVAECRPHPKNYNRHSEAQVGDLCVSLRRFGQVRSIVVQADGHGGEERPFLLVAGEGVWTAAQRVGLEELRADVIPGDWDAVLVEAYLAADNELARAADPDEAQLALLVAAVKERADEELARLAAGTAERLRELEAEVRRGQAGQDPGPQLDRAAELQEKWQVERGQVWEVGDHCIVCGDCTDATVVEAVMRGESAKAVVTDPPYGIGLDTDYTRFTTGFDVKRTVHAPIVGDDKPFDPRPFLDYATVVLWGANFYAKHLPIGSWLIWDKRFKNSTAFLSDAELAWMKGGHGIYIFSLTSQGCVRPEKVQHPTQKPIEVVSWCIEKCKAGPIVYDPFLGSGTTAVACQQLGRKCKGVEIEPKYVAVTLERLAGMGLEPKLMAF